MCSGERFQNRRREPTGVHWLDIVVVMIIGFGTYIGTKRGLVLELTDWTVMILAGIVAFRGFRPLGEFLNRMIKAWPLENCETIAFWFLLLFVGLAILTAGLHLDRQTREFDRIPPEIRNYGGGFVALSKSLTIACLVAVLLPYASGLTMAEAKSARRSAGATAMRALGTPVGVLVGIVCPSDLAEKWRKACRS